MISHQFEYFFDVGKAQFFRAERHVLREMISLTEFEHVGSVYRNRWLRANQAADCRGDCGDGRTGIGRGMRAPIMIYLPDIALIQSPQLAQLAPCVVPETDRGPRGCRSHPPESGKPCDNAQLRAALEQHALAAADVFERGGNAKSSAAEIDIKSLHAKIGELVLENDFLERALGKVGLPSAKR